ncbi:hypothetical protein BD770DRAFT_389687, partial [Pilaira anomala]
MTTVLLNPARSCLYLILRMIIMLHIKSFDHNIYIHWSPPPPTHINTTIICIIVALICRIVGNSIYIILNFF